MSLLTEPGFMAKNQLPTQVPQWVTVPGIAHLDPHETEWMLCPLRQLQLYLHDTGNLMSDIFIRVTSPNGLSRW